jgi:predicted DNA-binding transcriptional regulator AlpA
MLQTSSTRRAASASATISTAPHERRVLTETELANRWGISPKTLQRWRTEGRGPHYMKLSKRVTYPLDVVTEYERHALHASTSQSLG